jgi:signal transduction histidine kinase
MKSFLSRIPLQWRVFLATSITITLLFVFAGWGLQSYALSVASQSVRGEIRASIQAYEALWKARTQVLSATTALMSAMSDVRAAVATRDERTIRDSTGELWSRVSGQSAGFVVLDPEGHAITSLGAPGEEFSLPRMPMQDIRPRFPRQLAGYLRQDSKLFYIVLTPVYVQTSDQPMLLNVLCAGFRIDNRVASELKRLAPASDVAFLDGKQVFASTLQSRFGALPARALLPASGSDREKIKGEEFISLGEPLNDVLGTPIAELRILHSYQTVQASLSRLRRSLAIAWFATVAIALLVSSVMTRRLLEPVRLLDRGATEIASRNYSYRVPVHGDDELSRLAATFNEMCDSIERARADLIRQEQMDTIGRLGSSLVHDLRNPLAAIYGGAEMLMDGHLPSEHTRRVASNIYRASHRMQELLRDLLNVSRGEARNIELCRLRDIVDAAVESIQPVSTGVQIHTSIPESTEVLVDRTRAERVFTNLLSNAADVLPQGGEIFVYAKDEDDNLAVYVEDTGPGVPEEVRAQLFRPFITAGKRTGLGLGLTLSRQTMLELGGDLELVSDSGRGACFRLRFPKLPAELQDRQAQSVA